MILLVTILIGTLFIFSSRINRDLETEKTVDEIVNGITGLVTIAGDYLAYPHAGKVRKWDIRYDETESLVRNLPEVYELVKLRENLGLLNVLFNKLQKSIQNDSQSVSTGRVVDRIHLVSHELTESASIIIAERNQEVASHQRARNTILFFICLLLIVVSLISAFSTIKSIAVPLKELVDDTENIRLNNLSPFFEYHPNQKGGRNEFDELKQAFYSMTVRLNRTIEGLRRSEELLRESESRYRVLFEEAPISLWEEDFTEIKTYVDQLRSSGITDFRSYFENHPESVTECVHLVKIIDVNRETLNILGADTKEMLLENLDTVFGEKSYEAFKNELILLAESHFSFRLHTFNQTLQDSELEVILGLTVVPGYEDCWSKVLVSLVDVTEHMRVEAELSEYRNHLEELVGQRTDELKEKTEKIKKSEQALTYLLEDVNESRTELQQVNKEYDMANKELEEFAYVVSHDLKAPLRAISQLTYWIDEDYSEVFDADGREKMDLILQRVKRMDGLIDGILRYSRVGRIKEKNEQLDLNLLVAEVIDNIAPPDTVRIELQNELPMVFSDPIRMVQVFQNLIENGVKYMDKDEGVVTIGCVDRDEHWEFSVADNGPGIDEKYQSKIFKIFQTLKPRDEHESTGIGLTLVKKIINLYGGTVWVESKPGYGSAFFFTLPKKGEQDEKL
jgi:signal transduction histidine kinase